MRRARHTRHGERGFTLTELLVALTVTIIGLAGLLSLHLTAVRGNAGAGRSLEAMGVAEETLESLRAIAVTKIESDFQAITGSEWSPGEELSSVSGRAGQQYLRLLYAVELPGNPGLVRLRVQVLWSDGGLVPTGPGDADHSIELETLRTRMEML
jgi:prepilin-type N-terminal cleavage/methylation domain-containing protein